MPFVNFARGVKLDQLVRHFEHRFSRLGLDLLPRCSAEPVERGLVFLAADIFLHEIDPVHGQIESVAAVIFQVEELSLGARHAALQQSRLASRQALAHALTQARHRLQSLATRLGGLDPEQVVSRGYALIVTDDGRLVVAPGQIHTGSQLRVTLAHGVAELGIAWVRPE